MPRRLLPDQMEPWPIPPDMWAGETVAIIAGGWSVTKADVAYVAASGCKTIVINRSWELLRTADWLHGCDGEFWKEHGPCATRFPGIRTTCDPSSARNGIRWLRPTHEGGYDRRPGHIATGKNSGFQAIHCAVQAGAQAIVLLGYDQKIHPTKGKTHWHEGWGNRSPNFTQHKPLFATILPELRKRNIDVVNCSAQSALTCFPIEELRYAL